MIRYLEIPLEMENKIHTYDCMQLAIITATFSQFFFVAQNTRQELSGITSAARADTWSESKAATLFSNDCW